MSRQRPSSGGIVQVFGSDPEGPMPEFPSIKDFERVVNLIPNAA